ncbi:MAG: PfkB family carbohydrate kinase [Butyrivibrio sp.]|jgi:sugar/nucleoside kinase (ribokinase family)|nr:PfkB family carbohydrate kinase [Butyrivibrio sp.]
MKKILVIGSTVADVTISLDHLPEPEEDMIPEAQQVSLGGCAFNASNMLRLFRVPYTLFSPVGTGIYGDFVRKELEKYGAEEADGNKKTAAAWMSGFPAAQEENGCCYCLVDKMGNRTFMALHGAEYRFRKEWFAQIMPEEYDRIYVCGLEIEEPTGEQVVDFLESCRGQEIVYAPGPRIVSVPEERQDRLLALCPVLHLNATEVTAWLKKKQCCPDALLGKDAAQMTLQETALAAEAASGITGNTVIVTNGDKGTACCEVIRESSAAETCAEAGNGTGRSRKRVQHTVPAYPAHQIDGTGAGDAHVGTFMACRERGMTVPESLRTANRVSALVVGCRGAVLSRELFEEKHIN